MCVCVVCSCVHIRPAAQVIFCYYLFTGPLGKENALSHSFKDYKISWRTRSPNECGMNLKPSMFCLCITHLSVYLCVCLCIARHVSDSQSKVLCASKLRSNWSENSTYAQILCSHNTIASGLTSGSPVFHEVKFFCLRTCVHA